MLAGSLAGPSAAQDAQGQHGKHPVTVRDLLRIRNIADAVISRDGERVVYVISEPDLKAGKYNSDLWLISVEGEPSRVSGRLPRRLTNGPGRDDTPRWAPDGKSIAFLSDRGGSPQIWRVAIDGGEAVRITDASGPIKDFEWSPDGRLIAFLMTEPETELEKSKKKEKRDVIVVDRDLKRSHVHLIELATGKVRQLTAGSFDVMGFSWSPKGTQIVVASRPTPAFQDFHHTDLYLVDVQGGKPRPLVQRPGIDMQPKWSPDGRHIAFLTSDGKESWLAETGLAIVPADGTAPPRFLTRNLIGTISFLGVDSFRWSADSTALFFAADVRVRRPLFAVSLDGELRELSKVNRVHSHISLSCDGRRLAFLAEDPAMPKEVYTVQAGETLSRRLTRTNPQVDDWLISQPETVRWQSKDGTEIEGLLVKPVAYKSGTRYPLLTYAHGGPASQFARGFSLYPLVHPQASRYPVQVFAGLGYAIFCPNPRGSAAYGEKFRLGAYKDWGGKPFDDIMTGIDKLIADGVADADRLGMMGWSYGGYMTAWAITQTDRFKAASAGAGVTNLESMYGTTDISPFLEQYFLGPPWKHRELYARNSAITYAGRIKTPTLIQHGEADERVPLSQGHELYRALKRNSVPVEFVIYPRQGHNPMDLNMQADVLQRNVDWFGRWIEAGR
jgi:dipeptidyl aminopeptidase/acylaminoacyl peptidase